MKKLLSFLSMAAIMAFAISCGEDDDPVTPTFTDPTVSAPTIGDQEIEATGTATFTVSFDTDLDASFTASSTGGITLSGTSADVITGNSVDVDFTTTAAGAASITLTITDSENQTANATAVFNVLDEGNSVPTISGIPATATITEGDVLAVSGVTLAAEDGLAALAVSVDGTDVPELGADLSSAGTSTSVDFEAPQTADFGVGTYTIVFTLTDVDGDAASFTHVLTVEGASVIDVFASADGTGTTTWTKDNIYVLRGFVFVNDGQTLTIEPGTIIKGQPGEGAGASALIVARGGMISAVGTAAEPIIFTALTDEISPANIASGDIASPNLTPTQAGRWGGLIVLGNATISAANDDDEDVSEAQIEGIPSSETRGLYGGSSDTDDSGDLAYVSIRHGGSLIGAGNEINGLTLGGVGSGTSITDIEVVANDDDGVEWFGGNVDITNLLVWNSGDDAVDTDQDWVGTLDNFLVITPQGGSAFELDGPEGSSQRGFHTITNGTIYAGDNVDHLVDWDGSTNAALSNLYFFGWTAEYGFIQDEDPDEEGDQNFNPIESFGGDASGTSSSWEYTLATGDGAADAAEIFAGADTSILSEVAENANTVGADATVFGWTWASQSGALAGVGIE